MFSTIVSVLSTGGWVLAGAGLVIAMDRGITGPSSGIGAHGYNDKRPRDTR